MVRVICDTNVSLNRRVYPAGEVCDLPPDVVASLGPRAKPVIEEAVAPHPCDACTAETGDPCPMAGAFAELVDAAGEPVQLPPGDPAVPCDLPADVIASLGGRAKPALEEGLAPHPCDTCTAETGAPCPMAGAFAELVDSQGEIVQLPPGDPAVTDPLVRPPSKKAPKTSR